MSPATEITLRAGWLWRRGSLGFHVDATALLVPVSGVTEAGEETAWFLSFLAGGGARYYFLRQAWAGLRFSLGVTSLHGAGNANPLTWREHIKETAGSFSMLIIRPEVTAGWTVWKGLTLYLTPFALDFCPRHEALNDNTEHVLRFHVGFGAGWQL